MDGILPPFASSAELERRVLFSHGYYGPRRRRTTALGPRATERGFFTPTPILYGHRALEILKTERIRPRNNNSLDAGSGDGGMVALLASHGFMSVGVEYDKELAMRSRSSIRACEEGGAFPLGMVTILHGDFLDTKTYTPPLKFSDFGLIFNYHNNHDLLAMKMMIHSPPGTLFLLYTHTEHLKFLCLSYLGNIPRKTLEAQSLPLDQNPMEHLPPKAASTRIDIYRRM